MWERSVIEIPIAVMQHTDVPQNKSKYQIDLNCVEWILLFLIGAHSP